jgi:hypothetical protein
MISIDWVSGWFAPKPCKNVFPGVDYDTFIYDSTWTIEEHKKVDM